MTSVAVSSIALACMTSGMVFGLVLQRLLPEQDLRETSRDSVKTGAGLIATLTALVLGLLVTSAKNSFDLMNAELTQVSTKVILLDRALAQYGEEAKPIRVALRVTVQDALRQIWPGEFKPLAGASEAPASNEQLEASIRALAPMGESQAARRGKALGLIAELADLRWLLFEQSHTELPTAFVVLLIFWLTVLFGTFGLLAPRNATVPIVLLVCAISVASVIFLIREMNHPLQGAVQISSGPARQALDQLGK